ncbi:MAG: flagellin lysine-N-methylase [Lachnospiraceae bacterium]|nr:flagellin lysine-N-methylase [Lachnospiraceae bacterium]
MRYYYPDYFNRFTCAGGMECPDSCCHIWQITVDKKTLRKYKKIQGALGKRMREKIDKKTGNIEPHGAENRCEFLNKDNLCDIVLELGEDYLCHTCHTHPRHEEVYYNVRERSLAITCPVACKELLMREEPVVIESEEDNKKDRPFMYFDAPLFTQLIYVRDGMLALAQRRDIHIFKRMSLLLGMAHDIERRIKKRQARNRGSFINKVFPLHPGFTSAEKDEIKKIVSIYSDISAYSHMAKHIIPEGISVKKAVTDMFFTLCTMEPLKNTWIPYIQSIINIRMQMEEKEYINCQEEFKEEITDIQLEQLLFYFVYLYCCSATYDRMLLAKIKMAVANTIIIRELWFMKWLEDDKILTENAQAEMAHWFVREVENSDENLEQWDSLMQRNPRFSLNLLIKVLECI